MNTEVVGVVFVASFAVRFAVLSTLILIWCISLQYKVYSSVAIGIDGDSVVGFR